MNSAKRLFLLVLSSAATVALLSYSPSAFAKNPKIVSWGDCVRLLKPTAYETYKQQNSSDQRFAHKLPQQTTTRSLASGSDQSILYSFEKEGLFYEDIAIWFPTLKPAGFQKLIKRFASDAKLPDAQRIFHNWLKSITSLEPIDGMPSHQKWRTFSIADRFSFLMAQKDLFAVLRLKDKSALFEEEILTFDDVEKGPLAPPHVEVGDDLGSYEVRLSEAIPDRIKYLETRLISENYLDGKVGHQHLFHGWPMDAEIRKAMAPYYIELLDATTWYLFWRQMRRDPEDAESILTHPYLGVYTRSSLDRLHNAVVKNQPKKFNNKFRMNGARAFPSRAEPGVFIPDWELRSGNKGPKREFVQAAIEARLRSGDYSGLRAYNESSLDPSAPIEVLAAPFLTAADIKILKQFEDLHPAASFSPSKISNNHTRNRIFSPLLPWQSQLPMSLKVDKLKKEQQKYAEGLVKAARKYIRKVSEGPLSPTALGDLRAATVEELEELIYVFARTVRLDMDYERYITPVPKNVPALTVPAAGALDVNKIPIGVEYSFRFPKEATPQSRDQADRFIKTLATNMQAELRPDNSEPMSADNRDSHGHGTVVKYQVVDSLQQNWRVEWDGIRRYYVDGKIRRAWGGHAEIPSPKFSPQVIDDGIRQMFNATRSVGMVPIRSAGGGHFNIDMEILEQNLTPEQGTRAVANFLSYFESERELILFMWMHPLRKHAAYPIDLTEEFIRGNQTFKGGWEDYGRFLYKSRYLNPFVGRKPKYMPVNVTALMTPILPPEYFNSLDIRNPKQQWFPSFGKVTGRIECRFFDAPLDEYMAALQIKYMRAVMNKSFNSTTAIPLIPRFNAEDQKRWKANPEEWFKDANEHLRELNLDPAEFEWLLWDSYNNRLNFDERPQEYKIYDQFLPPIGSLLRLPIHPSRTFTIAA